MADFASGTDEFAFDNLYFTALGTKSAWAAGLYYDPDGSGATAAQIVATFQGNPAIAASDITVY